MQDRNDDKNLTKFRLEMIFSALVLITGLGLVWWGFFIPPSGEIHPSVLVAFGEALSWVGAVLGAKYYYKFKSIVK